MLLHVVDDDLFLLHEVSLYEVICSVDGHLDRCQFGAVTSCAALNIQSLCLLVNICMHFFWEYI